MSVVRITIAALIWSSLQFSVFAAERIALTLPIKGRFETVAKRVIAGAQAAEKHLKANGNNIVVSLVDDGCDPDKSSGTAAEIRKNQSQLAIGSFCFLSAKALAKSLVVDEGPLVPVITYNTRSKTLVRSREVDELPLFSISAEPEAEARAVVDLILNRWSGIPFAIADDGSVYGRSLSDAIQLIGEEKGIKPVAVGNFRPLQSNQLSLLRRFQRSGVEALFIAAASEDVATIARDLKSLSYDWELASGETSVLLPYTESAGAVAPGMLMVRPKEARVGDQSIIEKLTVDNIEIDESMLHGYAMIEIAAQIDTSNAGIEKIPGSTYQTILGPVTFTEQGRAELSPFALHIWNGRRFTPVVGN